MKRKNEKGYGDTFLAFHVFIYTRLQIYTEEIYTPVKKCTSYKYLPYKLQCRSEDVFPP